jgi:hypothetical protein
MAPHNHLQDRGPRSVAGEPHHRVSRILLPLLSPSTKYSVARTLPVWSAQPTHVRVKEQRPVHDHGSDARDRPRDRHTGVHERKRACGERGGGESAIGGQHVRRHPHGERENRLGRHRRRQRPFRPRAWMEVRQASGQPQGQRATRVAPGLGDKDIPLSICSGSDRDTAEPGVFAAKRGSS